MILTTCLPRIRMFNFLPLLLAGAAGLGAGLLFGSRSSKSNRDDDNDKRLLEEQKRQRELDERRLQRIEEANQKMQEQILATNQEQVKQQELMRKRIALESAIGKLEPVRLEEGQTLKDEQNVQVSELYSDKLNNDWLDTITNYFKKKRSIKNAAFE